MELGLWKCYLVPESSLSSFASWHPWGEQTFLLPVPTTMILCLVQTQSDSINWPWTETPETWSQDESSLPSLFLLRICCCIDHSEYTIIEWINEPISLQAFKQTHADRNWALRAHEASGMQVGGMDGWIRLLSSHSIAPKEYVHDVNSQSSQ